PGSGDVGNVTVHLAPLAKKPGAPTSEESDLSKRPDVLDNMAEAWECTKFTADPKLLQAVGARESGRQFFMDRDKNLHALPEDRLVMGGQDTGEGFTTRMPCPEPPAGVTLGGFHTHPEVLIPPEPSSPADTDYAKNCGSQ